MTIFSLFFLNETLLHIAAMRGSLDVVKFLITQKIDIDAQTLNFKDTALHLAVQEGHEEIVKILLDAHANPNLKNCEILFNNIMEFFFNFFYENPIFIAVRWSRPEMIPILVKNGSDINSTNAILIFLQFL